MPVKTHPKLRQVLRDTAIIGLLTIGLLTVVELAIRWIAPQELRYEYGATGSPAIEDPLLGHVYRPGASGSVEGPEFAIEFKINDEGLRDRTPHPSPRPEGSRRILLLGDSFAFGAGNAYEKIWPVLLEQRLRQRGRRVDLVKAGVSAYDTTKEALYLERLFPRYQPDVVLIAFLPNDLFTNRPITGEGIEASGGGEEEVVQKKGADPFRLQTVLLAKRLLMGSDPIYSKLYLATERGQYFSSPPGERLREQLALTRELLVRIQRYCRDRGASLVVLSIPQQFQVIAKANDYEFDGYDPFFLDEVFAGYAREDGYEWIPTLEALATAYRTDGEDLYYRFDGHLTNAGNAVVAGVAADALDRLPAGPAGRVPDPPTHEQGR